MVGIKHGACIFLKRFLAPYSQKRIDNRGQTTIFMGVERKAWSVPDCFRLFSWPPNMGRLGPVETVELQPGFVMDRFGLPNGRFLSPQGVPFTNRALPANYESSKPYFIYEVIKPIPNVTRSKVLSWFGQRGLGDQLELPRGNINYLDPKNGYVKVRYNEW